ncbi:MAG: hypothetical protein IJL92_03575 [Thermoguttaceae bacterium]|nr:hypothetical protein [Thermoguttaceae bacterium]
MPKTEAFVAGRQITVDNNQFDVKFTKTIKQLEAGLSRAQKALGLHYNKQQQLNDALGRCVEGLSMWQVKLGMWVDETGRARTITGGFSEGLSKTDLELGRYIDDLGKVRSRTGDYVRDSEALIKAEKEKVDAYHQMREAFADAFDAIGDGAGRFASLIMQIEGNALLTEEDEEAIRAASFDPIYRVFSIGLEFWNQTNGDEPESAKKN